MLVVELFGVLVEVAGDLEFAAQYLLILAILLTHSARLDRDRFRVEKRIMAKCTSIELDVDITPLCLLHLLYYDSSFLGRALLYLGRATFLNPAGVAAYFLHCSLSTLMADLCPSGLVLLLLLFILFRFLIFFLFRLILIL